MKQHQRIKDIKNLRSPYNKKCMAEKHEEQGSLLQIALDNIRHKIKLDDVLVVADKNGEDKQTGKVIFKNKYYFVLQLDHYCESYTFISIALSEIRVSRVEAVA